ncbi:MULTISPECIES: hypothetical protein [unclassified Enterococcus]|uniref:hypothetical protein n=1 Tax=unclassified Enterococcus TaxID=2608891 RepID=UPI0028FD5A50|nr:MULTISPECIES: hypothetical protein [unclassified Enterococcus]MDU0320670.1 hypothetical protein [Enterococcus sp. 2STP]MDU0333955.1 hypothetical protein [Enterococcus sp. 2CBP]MDU0350394.1 hypothetical protein [Enterococcus sp. 3MOLP]
MLVAIGILGISSLMVSERTYAGKISNTHNDILLQENNQQVTPEIDHINVNSNGTVDVYLTNPIPALDYQCNMFYEGSQGNEYSIGNPKLSMDGREYLFFEINLSEIASVDKQVITNNLYFKLLDRAQGTTTKYAINNKKLLEVIENTMTISDSDTLVSENDRITERASTGTNLRLEVNGIDRLVPVGETVASDKIGTVFNYHMRHQG